MVSLFQVCVCLSLAVSFSGAKVLPEVLSPIHQSNALGGRIINGKDAQKGQLPWEVLVSVILSDYTYRICSGAILNPRWVLTSAQCVEGDVDIAAIMAGCPNITAIDDPTCAADLVDQFTLHEDFNNLTLENDIALIELPEELVFNENISAIALGETEVGEGVAATVAGWGVLHPDEIVGYTIVLQYAQVSTIGNPDCQKFFVDAITPNMVCTVGDNGQTPCRGDAGSPLVVDTGSDPVLVGLFSFNGGSECDPTYPAGYTRVAPYREWIRENTGV